MSKLLAGRKRFNTSACSMSGLRPAWSRMADRAVRQDLSEAGFNADLILANVKKLRSLVGSLSWEEGEQGWSTYVECSHVTRDRAEVSSSTEHCRDSLQGGWWTWGRTTGISLESPPERGALAIAIDSYEPVLDEVYRGGAGSGLAVALTDLANPSPSQGWAGRREPR